MRKFFNSTIGGIILFLGICIGGAIIFSFINNIMDNPESKIHDDLNFIVYLLLFICCLYIYSEKDRKKTKKYYEREQFYKDLNRLYNNILKILGELIIQEKISICFSYEEEIKNDDIICHEYNRDKAIDIVNIFVYLRSKTLSCIDSKPFYPITIDTIKDIINDENKYIFLSYYEKLICAFGSAFLLNNFENSLIRDSLDNFVENMLKENIIKIVNSNLDNTL